MWTWQGATVCLSRAGFVQNSQAHFRTLHAFFSSILLFWFLPYCGCTLYMYRRLQWNVLCHRRTCRAKLMHPNLKLKSHLENPAHVACVLTGVDRQMAREKQGHGIPQNISVWEEEGTRWDSCWGPVTHIPIVPKRNGNSSCFWRPSSWRLGQENRQLGIWGIFKPPISQANRYDK